MPPKRKPADISTTTTTPPPTTTSTPHPPTSTSNGKKKVVKKDDTSSEEEEDDILIDSATKKHINWYWAGDSKKGSQDEWILYVPAVATKIELAYQKFQDSKKKESLRKAKVDDDRYVDLKKMFQRRYDDKSKKRAVNRLLEDKAGKGPNAKPVREGKKKKKADSDSDDDDAGVAKKKARLNPKTKKKKDDSDSDYSGSDRDSADDVVSTDPDDSDDDDEYVKWSWAGDSAGGPGKGGGHQDIWLVYNKKMCKKLEKGFNAMKKRVKVDSERFIDMQNMLQRRYDDESKRRSVKREDPPKKKPKASPKVPAKKAGKKAVATDDSDDSEDDKKKKLKKSTSSSSSPSPSSSSTAITTTTSSSSSSSSSAPPVAAPPSPPSIASIIQSPTNWKKQTAMTYLEVELDKSDAEFDWMQDLFTSTIYGPHKTNPGLSPITFKGLNVTRVVRVQNPVTWMRYHNRKATVLSDAKGKCSPTLTKVLTNHPKGPPVDTSANEFFLFHGLNINSVIGICKFGFDPRFCSLQGMFGAGLYFAENSSKSNQYCHAGACTNSGAQASSCKCNINDELCLLVCRVTLGDPLVENIFRGNNPGDFWYNKRTEPKKSDNISIYNSVVGESKANYGPAAALMLREYIVYESSQVYPEYKVYYKRTK